MIDTINKRITQIESELAGLRREKLSILEAQVSALRASLTDTAVGHDLRSAGRGRGRKPAPSRGRAAALQPAQDARVTGPSKKRRRKRGLVVPDEDAIVALRKAVANAGKDGISAKQASQAAGISYPRTLKLMDSSFKKTGSRKWTRYHG